MKGPLEIIFVRHGLSAYNELAIRKKEDPLYQLFTKEYEKDFQSKKTKALAKKVLEKYYLGVSDYGTPLIKQGEDEALILGNNLSKNIELPDCIFVSPYKRTISTFNCIKENWKELASVKTIYDDGIRERECGIASLYNDWRILNVFNPDQKYLFDLVGEYWYQYPQGESMSQAKDRIRSFVTMLARDYVGKKIMLVTHGLTILAFRSVLENLTPEQFITLSKKDQPINCGVTSYEEKNGEIKLIYYNKNFMTIC